MKTSRAILTALAAVVVAGCVQWPRHGGGGMAEFYVSGAQGRNCGSDRIACATDQLRSFRLSGAEERVPAALRLAEEQWVRAIRSDRAGFERKAGEELERLDAMLDDLARWLDGEMAAAGVKER